MRTGQSLSWLVAVSLVVATAGHAHADERPTRPAKVSTRAFPYAVEFALGGLSKAEHNALFRATLDGASNRSAVEFQRWDGIAQKNAKAPPPRRARLQKKAHAELMKRVREGGGEQPWRAVREILEARKRPPGKKLAEPSPRALDEPKRADGKAPAPSAPATRAPGIPPMLIGRWFIGNAGFDWTALSTGNKRVNGNAESYVFRPNGTYEHVLVMKAGYQIIATYEAGLYAVRGNQIVFRVQRTDGFQQYGKRRQPLGKRTRAPEPRRFSFAQQRRLTWLVLDGKTRLIKK